MGRKTQDEDGWTWRCDAPQHHTHIGTVGELNAASGWLVEADPAAAAVAAVAIAHTGACVRPVQTKTKMSHNNSKSQ